MKRLTPLIFDTKAAAMVAVEELKTSEDDYYLYGAHCPDAKDCSTFVLADAITVFTIAALEIEELDREFLH